MRDPDDDFKLVARIAAGDEAAFSQLYRNHLDTVVAYLHRRVSDPELIFDLTAETFAAVVVGAARFRRGEAPVAAWLLGIARNKLLMALRRGRVEEHARQRLAMEPIALDEEDLADVERRAIAAQKRLAELLARLPEKTRRAVLARVVEARPYAQIAAELACSEQVVRQRVHRGLTQLRHAMESER